MGCTDGGDAIFDTGCGLASFSLYALRGQSACGISPAAAGAAALPTLNACAAHFHCTLLPLRTTSSALPLSVCALLRRTFAVASFVAFFIRPHFLRLLLFILPLGTFRTGRCGFLLLQHVAVHYTALYLPRLVAERFISA